MILCCVHEGMLWLAPPVFIDTQLIAWIVGSLKAIEDPTTLFTNKEGEKALAKYMKEKFHTFKGKSALDVANINDDVARFSTHVLV